MRVNQYMSRKVLTVTRDTDFHRALDLMRSRRIHHLPVVEAGRVIGMVAERDVLLAAANFGPAEVPVGEIMSAPAICVADSALLKNAARLLVEKRIGSLPVLDANDELVGIITETDIFKIAAGMLRARPTARKIAATRAGAAKSGKKKPRANRRPCPAEPSRAPRGVEASGAPRS